MAELSPIKTCLSELLEINVVYLITRDNTRFIEVKSVHETYEQARKEIEAWHINHKRHKYGVIVALPLPPKQSIIKRATNEKNPVMLAIAEHLTHQQKEVYIISHDRGLDNLLISIHRTLTDAREAYVNSAFNDYCMTMTFYANRFLNGRTKEEISWQDKEQFLNSQMDTISRRLIDAFVCRRWSLDGNRKPIVFR